jgi:hypothetical protein
MCFLTKPPRLVKLFSPTGNAWYIYQPRDARAFLFPVEQ